MLGAIAVYLLLALVIFCFLGFAQEKAAHFGDAFGAINTLFTGLALAYLIYATRIQKDELNASVAAQEELAASSKAQLELLTKSQRLESKPVLKYSLNNPVKIFRKDPEQWSRSLKFEVVKNFFTIVDLKINSKSNESLDIHNPDDLIGKYFGDDFDSNFKIGIVGGDSPESNLHFTLTIEDGNEFRYELSQNSTDTKLSPLKFILK